jgi:hypothetical protein
MKIKTLITLIFICSIFTLYAESEPTKDKDKGKSKPKVMKVIPQKSEILYEVKDGEVVVTDSIITNIIITKNVTVAYRNKTKASLKPEFKIKFYNAYGLLLGKDDVGSSSISFGSDTRMEPKEISSEKLSFTWYPIENILLNTSIQLPADFKSVKWIIISESNTQLPKK